MIFATEEGDIAQQREYKSFLRHFKQQTIENNNLYARERCTTEEDIKKFNDIRKLDIPGGNFSLCAYDVVIE